MAETHPATSMLVDAVRKNAGGLLKVQDQVAALAPGQGGELAFLDHIGVEGRVALLERGVTRVMVEGCSAAEILPFYRTGLIKGLVGEEAHAVALTPELHGKLPFAAVRRWISGGDWHNQTSEAAIKLRAAILRVIMERDKDADVLGLLFNLTADDLLGDAKKDKLVSLVKAARMPGNGPMDELLLTHFSTEEIAACARSSWQFVSSVLENWEIEEQELGADGADEAAALAPAPASA